MPVWMWVLQVVLAFLYTNFLEWSLHKYLLHGIGKRKGSFFSFHWRIHHRKARQNAFQDDDYNAWPRWHSSGKEVAGLALLALVHLPLLWYVPVFYLSITQGAILYYLVHSHAHRDPEWAKQWVPWHYQHHCGPDQDKNFCVTSPFFDYVMGTRVK